MPVGRWTRRADGAKKAQKKRGQRPNIFIIAQRLGESQHSFAEKCGFVGMHDGKQNFLVEIPTCGGRRDVLMYKYKEERKKEKTEPQQQEKGKMSSDITHLSNNSSH